jgi:Tfp pilus assembly protein PilO
MKSSLFQNAWTVPLLTAGVAGGYLFLVFLPGQKALARAAEDLAVKRQFVAQSCQMGPAVQVTQQAVKKVLQYNTAWRETAPTEQELTTLFGQIYAMAKDSGVTMTRFDPQEPEALQRLQRIPVVVGCSGQFGQVSRFFERLERLPQTIWIENLKMEAAGQVGENVQCEVVLAIFADNPKDSDQGKQSG